MREIVDDSSPSVLAAAVEANTGQPFAGITDQPPGLGLWPARFDFC